MLTKCKTPQTSQKKERHQIKNCLCIFSEAPDPSKPCVIAIPHVLCLFVFLHLQEMVEAAGEDERELAAEMAAAFLNENLPEAIFGAPKAGAGQWASLVRLINPIQGSTLDQVQLEQNEAAFR